jgi:hypothetical protein
MEAVNGVSEGVDGRLVYRGLQGPDGTGPALEYNASLRADQDHLYAINLMRLVYWA